MKKIDIHTHIMPEKIPNWFEKFGYGDFIHLEHAHSSSLQGKPCCAKMMKGDKFFREIESNCWEPKDRIIDMSNTHVDIQVLSTIPVLFNYWAKPAHGLETSRFFNDHIATCVDLYPKQFIGLGTVPLQDIDIAIREMERVVTELKMPGIEIGSNINQRNLSDKYFFPFWEAAQQLNCSIFIHPWDMMGENEMSKYWLPWLVGMPAETSRAICSIIFGGVLTHFPGLKIAFAHGGGSFPATIGRIEHGFNVRPDLCAIDNPHNPRNYLGQFWVDSLVHDENAFHLLQQTIGNEKICCGSDYPFPLGEHIPGALIESLDLADEVKQMMLFDNAMAWLA
ncbi:MAG: amidohydrolase [Bacteroidetes bacterium]|nr:amidohydrolase [Bacteroidota bacterium]MBK9480955.1 amidohydrolase [Bacteroidota bacterium]